MYGSGESDTTLPTWRIPHVREKLPSTLLITTSAVKMRVLSMNLYYREKNWCQTAYFPP